MRKQITRPAALGLVATLLVTAVLLGGIGGVSAASATNTTTVLNSTVSVSQNTQSVYVEALNTSENVTVTLSGLHNGTTTELTNHTIAPTNDTLWTYPASSFNTSTFSRVRVVATAPANLTATASVNAGVMQKVASGGGGGWLGKVPGGQNGAVVIALAVVAGLVLLTREN